MYKRKIIVIILLTVIPMVSYYYLHNNTEFILSFCSINNLVGIVAIFSGITGIIMGLASARQASLDAVKEYFQQGDEDSYSEARKNILEAKNNDEIKSSDVNKICNFFHFWGLMNKKYYLPIWVFDGSSGLQIVKQYMKLKPLIIEKRKKNRFYAIEFEHLSYRIYKKYKKNFSDLDEEWQERFEEFKVEAYKK